MTQFLGTHLNRLDAKGRVSVPAAYRNALRALSGTGDATVVLRPSHVYDCIEAWPIPAFNALSMPLEQLDVFSETHDDMAAALYADAYQMDADREGRIILPESLIARANLTETVMFMGLGKTFSMWEPAAGAAYLQAARERARTKQQTLPGRSDAGRGDAR